MQILVSHSECSGTHIESKALRKIFGPETEEVTVCRFTVFQHKIHFISNVSNVVRIYYVSANIIGVIQSRRMKWDGRVACTGERFIQNFNQKT
jgi:hypothetical protein